MSDRLRAQLATRIRTRSPRDWPEFCSLWMAFNAIYQGEPDARERARLMASIRGNFTETSARRVLRASTASIKNILSIPPGNLLLNRWDPNFRAASLRYAAMYRNKSETAVGRLAAVAAVLYQVRCNLVHGSKDPSVPRDRMLVAESVAVLRSLVPALEAAAEA